MAAPILQAQGTIAAGVISGVPTVTIPTHQANDILVVVAMIWVPATVAAAAQIPTPSGWTLIGTQVKLPTAAATADGWVAAFWRRATAAGTTVTLTRDAGWDTGNDTCFNARAYVLRGCKPSGDPWDATASAGGYTTANQAFPALTVSGTERTAIIFGGASDNLAFSMAAAGWTIGTEANDAGGTDSAFQTARQENISANTSASTSTVTAPAAGGYGFIGVSFAPDTTALFAASVSLTITAPGTVLTTEKTLAAASTVSLTPNTPTLEVPLAGVAFNAADGTFSTSGTVASLSHTHVTVGADRYLQVWVNSYDLTHTVATVTTNSIAMTPVGSVNNAGHRMDLWHLADPPLGTNAIVATWPGNPIVCELIAMSFTGVDQTTPATLPNTELTGSGTAPSMFVPSAGSGSLVSSCLRPNADPGTPSAPTIVHDIELTDGIRVAVTPGDSPGVTISYPNAVTWAMFAVDINVAGLGTPAAFEASVALAITTTALLTTEKPLAAALSVTTTATSALTTAIALVAAPTVSITTAVALTTEKRLAAASTVSVTTSGPLSTAIPLAATPTLVLTTTAELGIPAAFVASVSLTVTTAPSLTTVIGLAAAPTLGLTAAGALVTEKRLAGTALLSLTTSVDLLAGSGLQAAVDIQISASGGLDTAIPMIGSAAWQITAGSSLTTVIALTADATVVLTTAAGLTVEQAFEAAGTIAVTTSGALLTSIPLAVTAGLQITGAGTLLTAIHVQGAATVAISTEADLVLEVETWQGSGSLIVAVSAAALDTAIQFTSAPTLAIGAIGILTVGEQLSGLHLRTRWVVPMREVRWITIRRGIQWRACPVHTNGGGHMEIQIVEGSSEPIECYLEENGAPPTSPLSVTPELVLRSAGGTEMPTLGDVEILDAVQWKVKFTPDPEDFKAILGPYTARYKITQAGMTFYSPSAETDVFRVYPR